MMRWWFNEKRYEQLTNNHNEFNDTKYKNYSGTNDNDDKDIIIDVGVLKGGGEGVESERYADDNNYDEVVVVV